MVMDTADLVPGFLINYNPTGASRGSQSQISFSVAALNMTQALLQNPEMLRAESSFPSIFYLNFLFLSAAFQGSQVLGTPLQAEQGCLFIRVHQSHTKGYGQGPNVFDIRACH